MRHRTPEKVNRLSLFFDSTSSPIQGEAQSSCLATFSQKSAPQPKISAEFPGSPCSLPPQILFGSTTARNEGRWEPPDHLTCEVSNDTAAGCSADAEPD